MVNNRRGINYTVAPQTLKRSGAHPWPLDRPWNGSDQSLKCPEQYITIWDESFSCSHLSTSNATLHRTIARAELRHCNRHGSMVIRVPSSGYIYLIQIQTEVSERFLLLIVPRHKKTEPQHPDIIIDTGSTWAVVCTWSPVQEIPMQGAVNEPLI